MFVKIYGQSAAAEAETLDQIAGVGYRKALEFLVKDYCISQDEIAREAIEREFLGTTIDKRVGDPNIRECAKRAAWLGNDETHYTRKWEDKDIKDLKILIDLTMNWITNNILTKRYLDDMSEPRKWNDGTRLALRQPPDAAPRVDAVAGRLLSRVRDQRAPARARTALL
jgi:hypothetical protein